MSKYKIFDSQGVQVVMKIFTERTGDTTLVDVNAQLLSGSEGQQKQKASWQVYRVFDTWLFWSPVVQGSSHACMWGKAGECEQKAPRLQYCKSHKRN